jgi:DNA-binding transcriptional LysR family regulator
LRIAAPLLFAQTAFGQLGARFLAAYPDVQLDVVAQDRAVDLVEEHFDVAIRVNPREDSTLVGRCFATDRLVIAAAPSIRMPRAGKAGKPIPVPAVVLSSYASGPWPIDRSHLVIDPQPVMRASSLLIVRDAALAGVGVAVVPRSIIGSSLKSGELVQWGTTGKVVELWALHTSRRLPSAKVRAFMDFMRDQYPEGELVLQG